MAPFAQIDHWVFDLDNTLYAAECQLFAQIDARMTAFIERELGLPHKEARKLQKDFYVKYGTTMSGLMHEHDTKPEDFMAYVHDIDLSHVPAAPALDAAIKALPGKKYVYTNGSERHALNVLGALKVTTDFDGIHDIKAGEFQPKPHQPAYERFLSRFDIPAARAAMFEDLAQNLEAPHKLGMTTVLVTSDAPWLADEPAQKRPARSDDDHPPHVHFATNDLTGFLEGAL